MRFKIVFLPFFFISFLLFLFNVFLFRIFVRIFIFNLIFKFIIVISYPHDLYVFPVYSSFSVIFPVYTEVLLFVFVFCVKMVTSDQDRFSLEDYLSRVIAGDDGVTSVELKPMRESEYIGLPYNYDINERSLQLCSWNVHVTTSYLHI